jgi:hypothetical protein
VGRGRAWRCVYSRNPDSAADFNLAIITIDILDIVIR